MLAVTLTETQIGLGCLALVALLLGYHFTIGRYIRQQAGVKDINAVEIKGQPVEIKATVRYVEHGELDTMLGRYATTEDLHATEKRLGDQMEEDFRALDGKRSKSIGNLHEHLTAAVKGLNDSIAHNNTQSEERITKVHERVNVVAENLGGVRGELKVVSENLGKLTDAIQRKALGGKP